MKSYIERAIESMEQDIKSRQAVLADLRRIHAASASLGFQLPAEASSRAPKRAGPVKKGAKTSHGKATPKDPPQVRHNVTPGGRKRIAAAVRRRWARVRADQKSELLRAARATARTPLAAA